METFISCNLESLFGANDSETIQNAIAAAERDGCRGIRIPRYNLRTDSTQWRIGAAIKIPSDFTVILDNCEMVQETGVFDHMFTNSFSHISPQTLQEEQHDITILGVGNVCLSGGEFNGLFERTSGKYGLPSTRKNTMFLWYNVRNLRVENLHIENQRHWGMTHFFCRNVTLRNIDFFAVPHIPNMDGIDLRVGCHDFTIENVTGRTGDDTVAMTALGQSDQVEGKEPHIHHVRVRNVLSDPFLYLNVRILNQDGNQIHDIDVDTVMDVSEYYTKRKPRAAIGIGAQGNVYTKVRHTLPGETRDLQIRNVYSRGGMAVRLDEYCADTVFQNIKTFNTNVVGISTLGLGLKLERVVFDGFYYSSKPYDPYINMVDNQEHFLPSVLRLPGASGELVMKDVHVNGLDCLCELGGGDLQIRFEDSEIRNIKRLLVGRSEETVMMNGEVCADA